nr:hypothetical protein HK105_006607 [Polyrhizophydium stewartii]
MRSHVSAQLLPHPFEVRRHDMDPCVMDTTPEHRARMRKILYGERQKPVAGTGRESGNFHANYGDEVPPKWRSTTDAEYDRKVSHQILDNNNQNKESSKYMRESHFSLEAHEEPGAPMSLTKKDYCGKDPKAAQRANYRAVSEGHSTYPPIFRDENELVMHRGKEMPHTRQRPAPVGRFERKPMIDSSAASKSTTHFSLGDDITVWESVTSAAMKRHSLTSKPPPSEYESLEKSKSTVLDNPDLVLEPMQSVQRREQLGTDDSGHQTSQYQATFGASAAESAELARNHKRLAQSQPASKLCIIAEDFEDRRMGTSSQREDFRDPKLRASAGHSRRKIEEIKVRRCSDALHLSLSLPQLVR